MSYAIAAVIALIIDQLFKYYTTVNIVENTGEVQFIPGVLHLTNVHNTGAAFNIFDGARWFLIVLCLVFVAAVVFVLVRNIIATPGARWAAVFVAAGAVGNCLDRILCGYVVDMLEFEFISFPVFNMADIYITLGAIAFCVCLLLEKPKPEQAVEAAEPAGQQRGSVKTRGAAAAPIIQLQPQREPARAPRSRKTTRYTQPKVTRQPKTTQQPETARQPETTQQPKVMQQPEAAQQSEKAEPAPERVSYDLDDILAEFRDNP